jgi:hypothetical protein
MWIAQRNVDLLDLEWTDDEQEQLKSLADWYTTCGALVACRIHRSQLECYSLVLKDPEVCNDMAVHQYNELALDSEVNLPIFHFLRETFQPILVASVPSLVVGALRYSQTCRQQQERPPRVWYSPEIDASKFTLYILSHTPGGFQWLLYILLISILDLWSSIIFWNKNSKGNQPHRKRVVLHAEANFDLFVSNNWCNG